MFLCVCVCVCVCFQIICSGWSRWQLMPTVHGMLWSAHQQVEHVCSHGEEARRRRCGDVQQLPVCRGRTWCSRLQPLLPTVGLCREVNIPLLVWEGFVIGKQGGAENNSLHIKKKGGENKLLDCCAIQAESPHPVPPETLLKVLGQGFTLLFIL